MAETIKLLDGRTREFRGIGRDGHAKYFYYYDHCEHCGKKKGKSDSRNCTHCRGGPRRGLRLSCPACGAGLGRDELIVSMYFAGFSLGALAEIWRLSRTRCAQIVRGRTR